jgi:hypothetical protein
MHGTFGDNTPAKHRLTYRELAEHLGISPDAARMKAKRKTKAGRWAIIPGNHPSDTVRVELPADDLHERVGGERKQAVQGERSPRTPDPERVNGNHERLLTALEQIMPMTEHLLAANREAQARITDLTDQLLASHKAHAADRAELAAAEMREMGTKAELERAIAHVEALKDKLHAVMPPPRQQKAWWAGW